MRIPSILPRRQVETGNSSDSEVVIRQLQAQNERLRARLLDAYDRANGLEDARDAEAGKNVAMLQIVMDLTANMGLILEPRHLDALPVGAVISTDNNQAWTRIGVDTVSGHSLWLTPTEDEAFTSEQIDAVFSTVSLAWVPNSKGSH